MTLQEFSERTGLTPTVEEYRLIEAMYMAAGDMDKDTFCRDYKKHAGSMILAEYCDQIKTLKGQIEDRNSKLDDCHDKICKIAHLLIEKSCEHFDSELFNQAVKLIGRRETVIYKLKKNIQLDSEDIDYIDTNLQ